MKNGGSLKIGLVGATGMVGKAFMEILDVRRFPLAELRPFASENSEGKEIECRNQRWRLQTLKPGCFDGLDLVFFSSGDDISRDWAPKAVKAGAFAVDNSAAYRMDPKVSLVVPEVNGDLVRPGISPQIIANPNCSTIQLVVALKPLSDRFGLREVRVASYQSVSGAGQAGYDELLEQVKNPHDPNPRHQAFPHPIAFNVLPQIGSLGEGGFFTEELKVMRETRKILALPKLRVSAFTVRVPSLNAHSEAVWVELDQDVSRETVIQALAAGEGIVIQDQPEVGVYPTARLASGQDPVYVGRVHRDLENPNLWMMWVVSDNLRKGAALNGIQIAERIFDIA